MDVTNVSAVTDYTGEPPATEYSNPVTTQISDPPQPPVYCCSCYYRCCYCPCRNRCICRKYCRFCPAQYPYDYSNE